MCGRYVVSRSGAQLGAFFHADESAVDAIPPSWNIAPTQQISVLLRGRSRAERPGPTPEAAERPLVRRLEAARWGLLPSWVTSLRRTPVLFNARIEEAAEKPAFRTAITGRRAAVPASGYYEWRVGADGRKQPFYITAPTGEPFLFAGLYSWWRDPAAEDPARWLLSATILTQQATGRLADIHPRTPVILHDDLQVDWLDPTLPGSRELLEETGRQSRETAAGLQLRPVDRAVGSVRNNHAGLIDPIPTEGLGAPLNPR